jgi:hypothetical protein
LTKGTAARPPLPVQLTPGPRTGRLTPLAKLAVLTSIGNAAASRCRRHDDVSHQAQPDGCSRQAAYRHADKVRQAVTDAREGTPSPAALLREVQQVRPQNRQLRAENCQRGQALEPTLGFPKAQQQPFAVTAAALGVSDRVLAALLALLLGAHAPRRATVGRWVLAAACRAGRLLEALDRLCHALVRTVCRDEIFGRRRPVRVGVEPHRLAGVLAHRVRDRSGVTGATAFKPWAALRRVIGDGGNGLCKGRRL